MNNCFWNYKTIVPGAARTITISFGKFMFHNKCFSDHLLAGGGVGGDQDSYSVTSEKF